jgi:hypothetical protein
VYLIVAFAPESLIEDLRKLRAQCPPSGAPVADCHLALTPMLEARPSLPTEGAYPAFSVRTTEPVVAGADIVLPVEPSAALAEMQRRIGSAAAPVVPLLRALPPEQVEAAMKAIVGWRVNYSWVVRDLDVIGLHEGKVWRPLARLNFGRLQPMLG